MDFSQAELVSCLFELRLLVLWHFVAKKFHAYLWVLWRISVCLSQYSAQDVSLFPNSSFNRTWQLILYLFFFHVVEEFILFCHTEFHLSPHSIFSRLKSCHLLLHYRMAVKGFAYSCHLPLSCIFFSSHWGGGPQFNIEFRVLDLVFFC